MVKPNVKDTERKKIILCHTHSAESQILTSVFL